MANAPIITDCTSLGAAAAPPHSLPSQRGDSGQGGPLTWFLLRTTYGSESESLRPIFCVKAGGPQALSLRHIHHGKRAVHLPAIFRFSFGTNRAIRLLRVSGGESPEGWVGERTAPPARFFCLLHKREGRASAARPMPPAQPRNRQSQRLTRAKTLKIRQFAPRRAASASL